MPDDVPNVDGISPPEPQKGSEPESAATKTDSSGAESKKIAIKRIKLILIMFGGTPYVAYLGWSIFLMIVLPDPTGAFDFMIPIAQLVAMVFGGALLCFGVVSYIRVSQATKLPHQQRLMGFIRTVVIVTPGLILSGMVPFMITQEPQLTLVIESPTNPDEFIAPLPISFSLEDAVAILERRGLSPIEYGWDFNGDGEKNEDTAIPKATAFYERPGVYNVVARIELAGGSFRRITRRLTIPYAVFSYYPARPIIDESITFTVKHLVLDEKEIREVQWDFDSDGIPDEVLESPNIEHTFRKIGFHRVSTVVLFVNQTQVSFSREIEVFEPPPLPFPIDLVSESQYLISPPPFGTIFEVRTEEPLKEVVWDFGDKSEEVKGLRVGHTFKKKGTYIVEAEARAVSGEIAKVRAKVRIVDQLRLPDLQFDGSPEVKDNKIIGEVPVSIDLIPRTSLPLIEFFWEAPNATKVQETPPEQIKASYFREGTYIVTLIGQDPDGQAMRQAITIEVKPVSSVIAIRMVPEGGVAPLDVRFDASETVIPNKEISGFEWIFGVEKDQAPRQAGAQVRFTFEMPGTYQVQLNVYTTTGEIFSEHKTIVVRPPSLNACFTASRTKGSLGDKGVVGVRFESCSSGNPSEALWDFGDGSQSDDLEPVVVHTYEKAGKFKVTLRLKNTVGVQAFSEPLTITISP